MDEMKVKKRRFQEAKMVLELWKWLREEEREGAKVQRTSSYRRRKDRERQRERERDREREREALPSPELPNCS